MTTDVLLCQANAFRIDVVANGPGTVSLGRRHQDATVPATEIADHVAAAHLRQLHHFLDHVLRRTHEDDIRFVGRFWTWKLEQSARRSRFRF